MISDIRGYMVNLPAFDGVSIEAIARTKNALPAIIIGQRGDEPVRFGTRGVSLTTTSLVFNVYAKDFTDQLEPLYYAVIDLFTNFKGYIGNLQVQTTTIGLSSLNFGTDGTKQQVYTATIEIDFYYVFVATTRKTE